jgi:hypothetical protein
MFVVTVGSAILTRERNLVPPGTRLYPNKPVEFFDAASKLLSKSQGFSLKKLEDYLASGHVRQVEHEQDPAAVAGTADIVPIPVARGEEALDASKAITTRTSTNHRPDDVKMVEANAENVAKDRAAQIDAEKRAGYAAKGRNAQGQANSKFIFDPAKLADRKLDDLNVLAAELGHKEEFPTQEEAIAFLSKDRK